MTEEMPEPIEYELTDVSDKVLATFRDIRAVSEARAEEIERLRNAIYKIVNGPPVPRSTASVVADRLVTAEEYMAYVDTVAHEVMVATDNNRSLMDIIELSHRLTVQAAILADFAEKNYVGKPGYRWQLPDATRRTIAQLREKMRIRD